jgi:hypothetical protein
MSIKYFVYYQTNHGIYLKNIPHTEYKFWLKSPMLSEGYIMFRTSIDSTKSYIIEIPLKEDLDNLQKTLPLFSHISKDFDCFPATDGTAELYEVKFIEIDYIETKYKIDNDSDSDCYEYYEDNNICINVRDLAEYDCRNDKNYFILISDGTSHIATRYFNVIEV